MRGIRRGHRAVLVHLAVLLQWPGGEPPEPPSQGKRRTFTARFRVRDLNGQRVAQGEQRLGRGGLNEGFILTSLNQTCKPARLVTVTREHMSELSKLSQPSGRHRPTSGTWEAGFSGSVCLKGEMPHVRHGSKAALFICRSGTFLCGRVPSHGTFLN